jgi:hypothetical protein
LKPFTEGQKLTIIAISEMMAHTTRSEIKLVSVLPEPERVGYQNAKLRVGGFVNKGKRKPYYLDLRADTLVFEGWDLPIIVDSELPAKPSTSGMMVSGFSGNACFNLCGDPAVIRDFVDNRNLNPIFNPNERAKIIHAGSLAEHLPGEGELLYPDIEIRHAVIDRIKASRPAQHNWSDGAQFCSCGQDTVTCQGCGKLTCGDVAIWKESATQTAHPFRTISGNIGPCCFAKFGIGHAGEKGKS